MLNILWLASWYPTRLNRLNGDFIERHAKAASLENNIHVIHVSKESSGMMRHTANEYITYNDHCQAEIIYYQSAWPGLPFVHKAISFIQYFRHFAIASANYISAKGKPDLVHVHVAIRAGIIALFLKWKYKIPYVITEHWSGYCLEVAPNFMDEPWILRWLWKRIMKHASGCTTVSDYLGKSMKRLYPPLQYTIIPNVVDTDLFRPAAKPAGRVFRFVHISTLHHFKNPAEIIEAAQRLMAITKDRFELHIYGPPDPALVTLSESSGLSPIISFHEEIPQEQLAARLQQCDALLLYSSLETFGCVVIEANACGIPVIVSDIPALRKNVEEGVNGIVVAGHEPVLLAEKMHWLMTHYQLFDQQSIREKTVAAFSYPVVALQFNRFYREVLRETGSPASQNRWSGMGGEEEGGKG